ncbi:hypothetical protein [Armatimonas sp.]|uniref:hypothetical protein n=1 Tax=Armatimonas sp. TaxID=1872638 RepID=UPI00286BBD05|nr:hypothetical protein [Armatimonas sp.]
MKVRSIVVSGEVAVSKDYQSAKAGFQAHIDLDEGDNAKRVHKDVFSSLSELALTEARERLEFILTGGA